MDVTWEDIAELTSGNLAQYLESVRTPDEMIYRQSQTEETIVKKQLHPRPVSKSALRQRTRTAPAHCSHPRAPQTSPELTPMMRFEPLRTRALPSALGHLKQREILRRNEKAKRREELRQQHDRNILNVRSAITRLAQSAFGIAPEAPNAPDASLSEQQQQQLKDDAESRRMSVTELVVPESPERSLPPRRMSTPVLQQLRSSSAVPQLLRRASLPVPLPTQDNASGAEHLSTAQHENDLQDTCAAVRVSVTELQPDTVHLSPVSSPGLHSINSEHIHPMSGPFILDAPPPVYHWEQSPKRTLKSPARIVPVSKAQKAQEEQIRQRRAAEKALMSQQKMLTEAQTEASNAIAHEASVEYDEAEVQLSAIQVPPSSPTSMFAIRTRNESFGAQPLAPARARTPQCILVRRQHTRAATAPAERKQQAGKKIATESVKNVLRHIGDVESTKCMAIKLRQPHIIQPLMTWGEALAAREARREQQRHTAAIQQTAAQLLPSVKDTSNQRIIWHSTEITRSP